MKSPGMGPSTRITLVVILSMLAVAVSAAVVIAGVVGSNHKEPIGYAAPTPTQKGTLSLYTIPPSTPAPVRSTIAAPTPTAEPIPAPAATAPEVIRTIQAPIPTTQPRPNPAPKVCPTGTVISGLTDVTVQNERYTTTANLTTMVDVTGRGSIHNGTTSAVKVSLYIPTVKGLDVQGRQTLIHFGGDFDYTPPPGVPRPYEIAVGPAETVTYTFTAKEVRSATIRETVAWYVDPASNVGDYADFDTYIECMDVPVSPPANGPSLMNIYVPWGP